MKKSLAKEIKSDELKKICSVFASYPGILQNIDALIKKIESQIFSHQTAQQIQNHYIKYSSYYLKHPEGFEATKILIDYLINGIEYEEKSSIFLRALLKILLKLVEDIGFMNNSSYRNIVSESFSYLAYANINNCLSELGILKNIGRVIVQNKITDEQLIKSFELLYKRYLELVYFSFQLLSNPLEYLKSYVSEKTTLLAPTFEQLESQIADNFSKISESKSVEDLLNIASDSEILNKIRQLPRYFVDLGDPWSNLLLRVGYLFWIVNNEQLKEIHEFALRDLGRTLKNSLPKIYSLDAKKVVSLLNSIFAQFNRVFNVYPDAVLYALEEIGMLIYSIENKEVLSSFIENLISLGFLAPQFEGLSEEYIINLNRCHLRNLKYWFDLISLNPLLSKDLVSSLNIYLFFQGVHVKDTDIFQREITKILNSDISQIFYLIKPLLKKIPVYFNEINAEGQLRTISTEIDEIFKRKDPVTHFIRKQIHVESSPVLVDLIEETIRYWLTRDFSELSKYLPEEVIYEAQTLKEHLDELNTAFERIFKLTGINNVQDLVNIAVESISSQLEKLSISDTVKTKVILAVRLYQLIYSKYRFDHFEIESLLKDTIYLGLPDGSFLIEILSEDSLYRKIEALVGYLENLMNIIFSSARYEAFEDITHKRHFVAGIPSVSGRYSERKFNALSVFFRLETILSSLLDELEQSIDLDFITRATLFRIEKYLKLFSRILELNGIVSQKYINTLSMLSVALEIRRFTFSQYMDIFRNLAESVSDIVNTYCTAPYKKWLKKIIMKIYPENSKNPELINALSEKFLREIVTQYPGLSQLDRLIGRILKTAYNQAEKLDYKHLDLLMTYDPKKIVCDIYCPREEINDRIHLGNKGHNLLKLAAKGISVPPGFILTTEVFRCKEAINHFEPVKQHLNKELNLAIKRLESITKKKFGDPANPLLVSVRSGGAISMPGMMNSFLNVGINEQITEGLVKQTGKPWFVWDSYRRFLQCWGMSFGIDRDEFDNIINEFKKKYKVDLKIQFTPAQMREVAMAYRDYILNKGVYIENDPWMQLEIAISQVLNSWYSQKAKAYREILGISEDWGTAVVVQKMVFGNLDTNSGSGVLFTRNPKEPTDRLVLWGDFTTSAQGEDIVSGLVKTYPISVEQKIFEGRINEKSLEELFPEIYEGLREISEKLIYKERWDHQEVEFTFEGRGKEELYILQTREMSYAKTELVAVFVPSEELNSSKIGMGIGVSGGALSGRVVFDVEDIKEFKSVEPHVPVILVRADTVPDDIVHIASADGILTARGGSTSHASIIATKLGKTCVVGFSKMNVYQNEKRCRIGKKWIKKGDYISIDGRSGLVYLGNHHITKMHLSTEYF